MDVVHDKHIHDKHHHDDCVLDFSMCVTILENKQDRYDVNKVMALSLMIVFVTLLSDHPRVTFVREIRMANLVMMDCIVMEMIRVIVHETVPLHEVHVVFSWIFVMNQQISVMSVWKIRIVLAIEYVIEPIPVDL